MATSLPSPRCSPKPLPPQRPPRPQQLRGTAAALSPSCSPPWTTDDSLRTSDLADGLGRLLAQDNRKFFVLFTLYTALGALHVLLLLSAPALRAYARGEWDLQTPVLLRPSLLFLFVVALNGFLFAGLMFTIQIRSILTDPQSQPGEPGQASAWTNLKAVLGPRPSPAWLSPFASAGPRAASGPQAVV
ncbi:hypothetical protein E5288_WYG005116 [Bos mutus]|uniref:Uncharacterized protein n=1 Tax=Bos mutus TaxID=72004 RepID=A0A6B0S848_9CETA|nr:hypothetical protein [Bos mutus]